MPEPNERERVAALAKKIVERTQDGPALENWHQLDPSDQKDVIRALRQQANVSVVGKRRLALRAAACLLEWATSL